MATAPMHHAFGEVNRVTYRRFRTPQMVLNKSRRICLASIALLGCSATRSLSAQRLSLASFVPLAGESEERLLLRQLLGPSDGDPRFFRSPSTLSRGADTVPRFSFSLIGPEFRLITNSALPFSLNTGSLWAGRGTSTIATLGVSIRLSRVRVLLAPQHTTTENRRFQVIPYSQSLVPARSVWANPFHPPASSIDLPYRFGDRPLRRVDAGQSSVTVDVPRATIGFATENVWWGPGIGNAIVLSNNAAGFPHLFARTRDGIRTRVGRFDAQWMLGQLRESNFFDADGTNDVRSLSGLLVAWTPSIDTTLSIGIARTVTAMSDRRTVAARALFDVFKSVGQPNTDTTRIQAGPRRDQLASFFARWMIPAAGVAAHVEWARFEEPRTLRDLLEFPGHSQAYTLGLQWARPVGHHRVLRLQAEGTNLEPDASIRVRPVATSYTSRAIMQGHTNRGKALGASIGPGSSSQQVGIDLFGRNFRIGAFATRIRWDDATLWEPIVPQVKNEDVSVMGGFRGSVTMRNTRLLVEYTQAVRIDYLYQDKIADPARGLHSGVDILNRTWSFTLSTGAGR